MTVWIGIDPGLSGAVAFLDESGLSVVDTPVAVVKATRRDYLTGSMADCILDTVDNRPAAAALEQGIPMTRSASNVTYLLGRGGGLWEGILAASTIPYELATPRKWKKAMGIPSGSDKGASRMLASRLFPEHAHLFARVKDDGRAEAALLAEYRRRIG